MKVNADLMLLADNRFSARCEFFNAPAGELDQVFLGRIPFGAQNMNELATIYQVADALVVVAEPCFAYVE